MNNIVVFAAAGNGKTYTICKKAKELAKKTYKEILVISYTNEGKRSIENEYRKQNLGVIDKNVVIKTWYNFVLSDLIKPYQCRLSLKFKHYKKELTIDLPKNYIKSIAFYEKKAVERIYNQNHVQYYLNNARDIHKDNVSTLAMHCIDDSNGAVLSRLKNIYSQIFIDELQDYAGWDLEIFRVLFESTINIYCVGDYKQATFRTNNSNKNRKFRDDRIYEFFQKLEKEKLCLLNYSNETRRFNQEICNYVNRIYPEQESLVFPNECLCNSFENSGVYLIDNKYLSEYCKFYHPTILRYNRNSKIKFEHDCEVYNYGNSKGSTFDRVIIIPLSTVQPFILKQIMISSKQTRAKFYVACTRTKYSIVFAMDNPKETEFFKETQLTIGNNSFPAFKFENSDINKNF